MDDLNVCSATRTYIKLRYRPIPQNGGTSNDARYLIGELKTWVNQFEHEDALTLGNALNDIERLFVRVWTEIDESLSCLSDGKRNPHRLGENLNAAMKYLGRWQDRGGRIGNVGE